MRRLFGAVIALGTTAFLIPSLSATRAAANPVVPVNREVEAVVMKGADFQTWSRLPAQGVGNQSFGDTRDAHYSLGDLIIPQDARSGVPVNQITAFKWNGTEWQEVPVQVDQVFPYYLINNRSSFGIYSRTDEELTYQWDTESWKKTAGECTAEYPAADQDPSQMEGYPTKDPVETLDDDDEVSFYASDSGPQAPLNAPAPVDTVLAYPSQPNFSPRQDVALFDPINQTTSYVSLFLTSSGPQFDSTNGYVHYQRDANADEWIDRNSFDSNDPEILGTSNGPYGPNLPGTVCVPTQHASTDRFPRDGMTVTTPRYRVKASGRWMVRETEVAEPGTVGPSPTYGPDLIDRWKGRAFQQSPDSNISVVGFEDEQVNWEANSALLGERFGPVRAIREVWGADSGTNVTKTEYYYRDFYLFRYHLRVHPIPPDGLYTSWDHNHGAVTTYYNEGMTKNPLPPDSASIDGKNDDVGNIDSTPISNGTYFDASDPTFGLPLAIYNWEEVSGSNGSLVYMFELNDAKDAEQPAIIPYYRDDSCFDDGTGDDPSPRVRPGEATSDTSPEYRARPCWGEDPDPQNPPVYSTTGPWRQGCVACHGVHYLFTNDTDNAFMQKPTTEVDGQQFIWAVPTNTATNVGEGYANTARFALVPTVITPGSNPPKDRTEISNTGPTSGTIGHQVTLVAHLQKQGDGPLAGKEVRFAMDGQEIGTATTDSNGDAHLTITLQPPARQASLNESFAGDDENLPSSTTVSFQIEARPTRMSLSVGEIDDGIYRATAVLRDAETGNRLAHKNIDFYKNGKLVASDTTDSKGRATAKVGKVRRGTRIRAEFAGDDTYAASSASRKF